MRWLGSFIVGLGLLAACGQEDCSLLADQAILAFERYDADTTYVRCIEAKEALEFYILNCEEGNQLEDALESLPCQ